MHRLYGLYVVIYWWQAGTPECLRNRTGQDGQLLRPDQPSTNVADSSGHSETIDSVCERNLVEVSDCCIHITPALPLCEYIPVHLQESDPAGLARFGR